MKYIYVRGGDKKAPIAIEIAGCHYGIRHDSTAYDNVHMLDVNWKNYDWVKVLQVVERHKPVMVVVPDYETPSQYHRVMSNVADLRALRVPEILVVPKWANAIAHIPSDCIVAISMPAPDYAGYIPPNITKLKGRRVHLLGGRPDSTKTRLGQAEAIIKLNGVGATVVSVDGNYSGRVGQLGRWFDGGKWQQTRSRKDDTAILQGYSLKGIITYLEKANSQVQPMLL